MKYKYKYLLSKESIQSKTKIILPDKTNIVNIEGIFRKHLPFLNIPFDYIKKNPIFIEYSNLLSHYTVVPIDSGGITIYPSITNFNINNIDFEKYKSISLRIKFNLIICSDEHLEHIFNYIRDNNRDFSVEIETPENHSIRIVISTEIYNSNMAGKILLDINENNRLDIVNRMDNYKKDINDIKKVLSKIPTLDLPYDYFINNKTPIILGNIESKIQILYTNKIIIDIPIDSFDYVQHIESKNPEEISIDINLYLPNNINIDYRYICNYIIKNNYNLESTALVVGSTLYENGMSIKITIRGKLFKNILDVLLSINGE